MNKLFQVALVALIAAEPASAEPSNGYLKGKTDFIQYSCIEASASTLTCEFTQVTLRPKAEPEDLEKRMSRVEELMSNYSEESLDYFCGESAKFPMAKIVRAAREGDIGGLEELGANISNFDAEEIIATVNESDPRKLEDMLQGMENALVFCDGVTRDKVENTIRLEYEKDARTCKLWINPWKDTFERVSDRIWSIQSGGPRGECGVVRLDRFECDEEIPMFCNYVSEKRVLNKDGGTIIPCNDLDETLYEYRWNSGEIYLNCVSVEFP